MQAVVNSTQHPPERLSGELHGWEETEIPDKQILPMRGGNGCVCVRERGGENKREQKLLKEKRGRQLARRSGDKLVGLKKGGGRGSWSGYLEESLGGGS